MAFSEMQLLQSAIQGDVNAFETLVETHEKRIYNLCLRTMSQPEDAWDMTQETLIKAWANLAKFKGKSAFGTWLYRIAVNTCMDELRRRKKHRTLSMDHLLEGGFVSPDPKGDFVDSSITRDQLEQALSQLTPEHRVIMTLRDIQGFSYEEIANILQCPLGTVRSRINRARGAMMKLIREQEGAMKASV